MLEPRHSGSHHTVNIKYGYLVLFVSAVHALFILWATMSATLRWRRQGQPPRRVRPALVVVSMALWVVFVAVASIWYVHLPHEYTTTVKRLGRIAYALVPLDLFLVLRPAGQECVNYLNTMALHKWISRLIVALAALHGVGYFAKWVWEGKFAAKATKGLNLLGILPWAMLLGLAVVSVRYFRRRAYRLFYLYHNATVATFVVAVGFHARPGVLFLAVVSLGLIAAQVWLRWSDQIKISADQIVVAANGDSRLQVVRIPKIYFPPWVATSHIRVGRDDVWTTYLFPAHPFTIASTIDDATLDLVVSGTAVFGHDATYSIVGPYPSLPEPFFDTASHVSVLCGGSGILFGLPIVKGLNQSAQVDLYWCVRNKNDLFILKTLEFAHAITVYVTTDAAFSDDDVTTGLLDDAVELDTLQASVKLNIVVRSGRPDYDDIFGSLASASDKTNRWLVACGPQSLVESARKWSAHNLVPYLSEVYEL